jgi:sigma-B regulation protein RsbU (phosphoserine phosphatase)
MCWRKSTQLTGKWMRILIADDDRISKAVLERALQGWGHEVVVTCDGLAAWQALEQEHAPKLAVLDWMMPELSGPDVCRRVRALSREEPTYLILLTAKYQKEDVIEGLESGANDFVVKPFDWKELRSRIGVGERMVAIQHELAEKICELKLALSQVQQLQGLLPICCYCKKIRDDGNYWQRVETYLASKADVQFSHGICPDCYQKVAADMGLQEAGQAQMDHAEVCPPGSAETPE